LWDWIGKGSYVELKWEGKRCGTEMGREALWDWSGKGRVMGLKWEWKCCRTEVGRELLWDWSGISDRHRYQIWFHWTGRKLKLFPVRIIGSGFYLKIFGPVH
jgi:hypothetical protein